MKMDALHSEIGAQMHLPSNPALRKQGGFFDF